MIQQVQQIMENFYLCTHLPIRIFTINGDELLSTGFWPGMTSYQQEVSNWLSTNPISSHLVNLKQKNTSRLEISETLITFSPAESIHYTICPASISTEQSYDVKSLFEEGYYLIGPYTSDFSLKETFLFKPDHCIPHLVKLLHALGDFATKSSAQTIALDDYNYHIARAQKYIKAHYTEPITLDILAEHLSLNKSYLCTIFKKATKDSFCNYTNKIRIEASKKKLTETSDSLTEIALSTGFSSASYFNTIFKKFEGKTPLEYRKEVS